VSRRVVGRPHYMRCVGVVAEDGVPPVPCTLTPGPLPASGARAKSADSLQPGSRQRLAPFRPSGTFSRRRVKGRVPFGAPSAASGGTEGCRCVRWKWEGEGRVARASNVPGTCRRQASFSPPAQSLS